MPTQATDPSAKLCCFQIGTRAFTSSMSSLPAAKASPLILVPWTPPHPLVPFKAQAFFQARLQFAQRLQQQQALVDEAAAAERIAAAALEQNVIAPPGPVRSIAPAAAR